MKVAQEAHQLGRALGAVPGPVTSATSVGPNDLLAEGVARMVRYADDVTIRGKRRMRARSAKEANASSLVLRRGLPGAEVTRLTRVSRLSPWLDTTAGFAAVGTSRWAQTSDLDYCRNLLIDGSPEVNLDLRCLDADYE